jgi:hypothetical protein
MPSSVTPPTPVNRAPTPALPGSPARTIQREPSPAALALIGSYLGGQDRANLRLVNTQANAAVASVPNLRGTAKMDAEHHAVYTYGGVADKLDPFLTGALSAPTVATERIDIEFRARVMNAIAAWDCQSSIMNHLLLLISSQPAQRRQWVLTANQRWQPVQPLDAHILEVFLARREAIAKRLVSAKHTMDLRIRDMAHFPNQVWIVYSKGVGKHKTVVGMGEKRTIIWQNVLTACRTEVRAMLTRAELPPPPREWNLISLDTYLLRDAVLKSLIEQNVLDADGRVNNKASGQYKPSAKPAVKCDLKLMWENEKITKALSGDRINNEWNFSLGHLRFMMFTEWKMCFGLLTGRL